VIYATCQAKRHVGPIYLSGPMTGYIDDNFAAFNYVAQVLRMRGFYIVNPAEMGKIEDACWADYLKRDVRILLECTGVIRLPGWQQSSGATIETDLAEGLGYPMWDLGYFLGLPENGCSEPRRIVDQYLKLAVLDHKQTL